MKMNRSENYLYRVISRFQKKYKLSYKYSIANLISDLKIALIPYNTHDNSYMKLIRISKDGFTVCDNKKFYIFYNPLQIGTRKNFTLAHELGHIVLQHHKISGKKYLAHNRTANNLLERQANIFARNILMPVDDTVELLKVKRPHELTEHFDVSKQMCKIRIKTLSYDKKWLEYINNKYN